MELNWLFLVLRDSVLLSYIAARYKYTLNLF